MNKKTFARRYGALFALMSLLKIDSAIAQTVTIDGQVTANTCVVNPAGSLNVVLPSLPTSQLPYIGSTAGSTFVELNYSGCTLGASLVTPYFEIGNGTNPDGRIVNNAGSGGALNVELQLKNSDGSIIDLSKPYGSQNVSASNLTSSGGRSAFIAEYFAAGAVGAGSFSAQISYSLVYQ